jgi:hypothetical protein
MSVKANRIENVKASAADVAHLTNLGPPQSDSPLSSPQPCHTSRYYGTHHEPTSSNSIVIVLKTGQSRVDVAMEFGIAGRMMMAVEAERLATSPSSTKNELEPEPDPIQMLELEVEALTLDLDEERARLDEQRSGCEKHLRELQNAETDLFECRQALEESEQKLALALVESEEKSEVLKQTEEQMLRSREQAREAERQMHQAKTQMLVQGKCVLNMCTNIVPMTPRQFCR